MFYQPIQSHQHLSYNQDTCQYLGYTVLVYQYKLHYDNTMTDHNRHRWTVDLEMLLHEIQDWILFLRFAV